MAVKKHINWKSLTVIFMMTVVSQAQTFISPNNPHIHYVGRFDFSRGEYAAFDWPGVYIQAAFQGTLCKVIMEGEGVFDAFIDGDHVKTFQSSTSRDTLTVASGLKDAIHSLRLVKRNETSDSPIRFYGFLLDEKRLVIEGQTLPERKIEFIGDSYTAGFANEYQGREAPAAQIGSIILTKTNADKAFGPITARVFDAQYHIHAISGKGLVRNYNGADPGAELPVFYPKTLRTSQSSDARWDFSGWKADVVVIGIGINDFQADPPYADSTAFDSTYIDLLNKTRSRYPGVKIICCATKVWPTDALIPRIKHIVESQTARGHKDIRYYEYATENNALYGHPDLNDHKTIAEGLIAVIEKTTGWKAEGGD